MAPYVANKWYELGLELIDKKKEYLLDDIETNIGKDVKKCCLRMFRIWLDIDGSANWKKIVKALKSPGVDLNYVALNLQRHVLGTYM